MASFPTSTWLVFLLLAALPASADQDDKFSSEQERNIVIVSIFFSAISFCGSSFIVFMYMRHPSLRSFVFQLVVWISASDMLFSVGNAIGNPADESPACYTQAIFVQFFGLSSMLWTAAIAYTVDAVYLKGRSLDDALDLKKRFHLAIWGFSALFTILPATTDNYGQSTGWCWISVENNAESGTAWRFVCFYIPLWMVATYNICVYARVRSALNEAIEAGAANVENIKHLQRMVYYPLVLVGCYFFGTVSRIQQIVGPPIYGLVILHTIGMSSQGTCNALVYGLTPSVKQKICGDSAKMLEDEPSIDEDMARGGRLVEIGLDQIERKSPTAVERTDI